jgi:hypothetical protein
VDLDPEPLARYLYRIDRKLDRLMTLVAVDDADLASLATELTADDTALGAAIADLEAKVAAGTPLAPGDLGPLKSAVAATAALVPVTQPLPAPVVGPPLVAGAVPATFIDPASGAQVPNAGLSPAQQNLAVSGHPDDLRTLATQGPDAPANPQIAPRFDPNTGAPIPAPRFDPNTGQPLS